MAPDRCSWTVNLTPLPCPGPHRLLIAEWRLYPRSLDFCYDVLSMTSHCLNTPSVKISTEANWRKTQISPIYYSLAVFMKTGYRKDWNSKLMWHFELSQVVTFLCHASLSLGEVIKSWACYYTVALSLKLSTWEYLMFMLMPHFSYGTKWSLFVFPWLMFLGDYPFQDCFLPFRCTLVFSERICFITWWIHSCSLHGDILLCF